MVEIVPKLYAISVPIEARNFSNTHANGIMWENDKYLDSMYFDDYDFGNAIHKTWQTAENALVKKLLILEKI